VFTYTDTYTFLNTISIHWVTFHHLLPYIIFFSITVLTFLQITFHSMPFLLHSIAFHCILLHSIVFHCIPLHSIYLVSVNLLYSTWQYSTIYTHIHTPTHTKYMHSMPFHCIPFGSNPFRCRRTTHTRPDQTSHHTSHKNTHTHSTSIYRTQYNTTERKEATYTKYTHNTIDYSII